jgi:hypothetical protein
MPKPSVTRKLVTTSPEILATETLIAVTSSETIQEAADKLKISRKQVHERIVKYGLKEKILALKEDALFELTVSAPKAARNLVAKLDSENDVVSKAASDSILDRVGVTKGDSVQANINNQFVQINNNLGSKYAD